VVAALIASGGLGNRTCEVLARGNSGDVSHDRSSVVGYAAAIVTGEPS
jgi:AmmeMemoRadiSam system protein B